MHLSQPLSVSAQQLVRFAVAARDDSVLIDGQQRVVLGVFLRIERDDHLPIGTMDKQPIFHFARHHIDHA